jgi:hypothetical protein
MRKTVRMSLNTGLFWRVLLIAIAVVKLIGQNATSVFSTVAAKVGT